MVLGLTPSKNILNVRRNGTFLHSFAAALDDGERITFDEEYVSAKMQVRPNVDSPTILAELSSDDGEIIIGADYVTLFVSAAVVGTWAWSQGVWDLTLTDAAGETDILTCGTIYMVDRVTE